MTDIKIIEAYFVARGWRWQELPNSKQPRVFGWWYLGKKLWNSHEMIIVNDQNYTPPSHGELLPNILKSFPDFKREVLEVMEDEDIHLFVITFKIGNCVEWRGRVGECKEWEEIKSNNILHAAVIAATQYFKEVQLDGNDNN